MNAARVKPQLEQNEDSSRFLQHTLPSQRPRCVLLAGQPWRPSGRGFPETLESHLPGNPAMSPSLPVRALQVPKPGLRVPPALVAPAVGGEVPAACFYVAFPWDLALEGAHQTWPPEARIWENLDLSPSSSALPLVAIRFYLWLVLGKAALCTANQERTLEF